MIDSKSHSLIECDETSAVEIDAGDIVPYRWLSGRDGARFARTRRALPINCFERIVPETLLVPCCVAKHSGFLRSLPCADTDLLRAASGRAGSLLHHVRQPAYKAAWSDSARLGNAPQGVQSPRLSAVAAHRLWLTPRILRLRLKAR